MEGEVRAIAKRDAPREIDRYGWEPETADQAWEISKRFYSSGLYPQFTTVEQLFTTMMKGREHGFSALASLDAFDMIPDQNGKARPALRAIGMLALIRRSPLCKYIKLIEDKEDRATWATLRTDDVTNEPATATYTRTEAELAGLFEPSSRTGKIRKQWATQAQVMLVWRALTKLARREYADLLLGLHRSAEELIDEGEEIDVTPVKLPTVGGDPQSTQELVKSKLAEQGVRVGKGAATGKRKADKPTEPSAAASPAVTRLAEVYDDLLKNHDPTRAKAAWLRHVGSGRVTDEEAPARLKRAEDLTRRFEVGAELEQLQRALFEVTGEEFEPYAPEDLAVAALEERAKGLTAELQTARAADAAREPGEEG